MTTKLKRRVVSSSRSRLSFSSARRSAPVSGTFADLQARHTALVKMQDELETSRAHYAELYNASPVGYIGLSAGGIIEEINSYGAQLLGFSQRQLSKHPLAIFVANNDQKKVREYLSVIRRSHKRGSVELELARKVKGHPTFIELVTIPSIDPKTPKKLQCALIDITARRLAENALRESETKFRTLTSHAPVGIFLCDENGANTFVNESWCAMTGLSAEDACGDGWLKGVHPDDRARVLAHWKEAVQTGDSSKDEFRFIRPDGKEIWVQGSAVRIKDSRGRFAGYIGTVAEITERKRFEMVLQRHAAIVASSDDAIVSKDLDGIINSWNQGAERIFGYKAAEIIGKSILTIIPTERHTEEKEILARIHRGEGIKHFETVRKCKDGRLIDVSLTISPVKNAGGEIVGASKIARDITERKYAEEQQRALYELIASVNRELELPEIYEMALDTIIKLQNADRASILLFDPDGIMRFKSSRGLSQQYCAAVEGHSPWNQTDLMPPPIFISDIAQSDLNSHLRDVIGKEGIRALGFIPVTYEKRLLGKFMIYYNAPHEFSLNEIRPAQTVASQIAFAIERKRAEAELKRATDEAERASRAKDDFLATLSHELRTPLNPVLLLASDAAANHDLEPQVRADFDSIRKNIELEARLIDDLLDLTRLSRGKFTLHKNVVDVHAVLQNALATVQGEIEQKQIALELNFGAERAAVLADDVRLQQIFWNVLKNAVKFTPAGGKISVQTSVSEALFIAKISDTGIGIEQGDTDHIFEAFSQGSHSGFGGLGLGLAISKKLIEQHDGRIHAISNGKNQGATFSIELPLAKTLQIEDKNFIEQKGATAARSPQHIRILLVEDHEPTRTALTHLLARRNHKVTAAASASEARSAVGECKTDFDLVISDIGLPDGSGYDLMAELRQRCGLRGIALTGYGMEQDVNRSLQAGFVAHLTKPVRMENLENALGAALQQTAKV